MIPRLNMSTSQSPGLNHSAILTPLKFGLRLPQLQGDVTRRQSSPVDFFGSGIRARHIRRIFSPFSSKARSLNHSAILLHYKMWSMPAIVTTGRNFSTIRPAYGLFWQQDSNLHISGVYLVRSPQKLGASTTRPSCCILFKIWLTPATVTKGRNFSTNPPLWAC